MELTHYIEPKERAVQNKIEQLAVYEDILTLYRQNASKLKTKVMSPKAFWRDFIGPIMADYPDITYRDYTYWLQSIMKRTKGAVADGQTLLEREEAKQKKQIQIRQDVTDLMSDFISAIKELATDTDALKKAGISPAVIYKIIREEEDRQQLVDLKRRAEDRADYAFAFLVSMTRANQITPEDIEFLEDDIKAELTLFKKANGVYELPTSRTMAQAQVAAENGPSLPDEGHQEGSL